MLLVGDYVIAITQSKGAYVINTKTNTVEKLISGTDFASVVQSKDGKVWIGANKKLIQIDPYTLEKRMKLILPMPQSVQHGMHGLQEVFLLVQNKTYYTGQKEIQL